MNVSHERNNNSTQKSPGNRSSLVSGALQIGSSLHPAFATASCIYNAASLVKESKVADSILSLVSNQESTEYEPTTFSQEDLREVNETIRLDQLRAKIDKANMEKAEGCEKNIEVRALTNIILDLQSKLKEKDEIIYNLNGQINDISIKYQLEKNKNKALSSFNT